MLRNWSMCQPKERNFCNKRIQKLHYTIYLWYFRGWILHSSREFLLKLKEINKITHTWLIVITHTVPVNTIRLLFLQSNPFTRLYCVVGVTKRMCAASKRHPNKLKAINIFWLFVAAWICVASFEWKMQFGISNSD